MPFADTDFIKLNLPQGTSFSINGVNMTLDDAAQNALDEGGSREMALAILFEMLESDQVQSEMVGKYSYVKFQMRGSEWWRLKAGAKSLDGAAPTVLTRPRSIGAAWRGCV